MKLIHLPMPLMATAIAYGMLVGCGSYAPPNESLVNSQASVRAAQEVGAQNNPQAALHLKLAQEQVDQARQLMGDGDNKRAEFVLLRAQADAELAVALAREASARGEAQQAQDELKSLKNGDHR
ncbi:MAG TPA: DUF4398 domain-containing protein [Polyangiaceae bacterium]|nr:DUF4398 domain-containing protein [Polyangiaceae bacterium]